METKNISRQSEEIEKLLKKGYEEIEAKRWDYAIIVFEKILSMDNSNLEAFNGILNAHQAHANDAIENENWNEALAVAETMKSIDDKLAFPYYAKLLAVNKTKEINRTMLYDIFFATNHPEKAPHPELTDDYQKMLKYSNSAHTNDIIELSKEVTYEACESLIEQGNLSGALTILNFLRGYKDTDEKIKYINYTLATQEAEKGIFERPKNIFKALETLDYKDSGTRAYLCEQYLKLENIAKRCREQHQAQIDDLAKKTTDLKERSASAEEKKIEAGKKANEKRFSFGWWVLLIFSLGTIISIVCDFIICINNNIELPISEEVNFINIISSVGYVIDAYPSISSMVLIVAGFFIAIFLTLSNHNRRLTLWFTVPFYIICLAYSVSSGLPHGAAFFMTLMLVYPIIFTAICSLINVIAANRYNKNLAKKIAQEKQSISNELEIISRELEEVSQQQAELQDKFKFHIETMLGDEVEIFESEAASVGFMVGYGKALIEKYSKI